MTRIEELNNYREDDSLNQSFLKACGANNPKVKKNDSESIACLKGSLTDCMILTEDLLGEYYHLSELERPPKPLIKSTMDFVFEQVGEWDNLAFIDAYRQFSAAANPTKEETILKGVEAAVDYWDELMAGKGKEVVTKDKWIHCLNAKNNLLSNPFTKHHFENTLFADITYQVPIFDEITFNGKQVKRKGLLDLFIIDEAHKTVQFKDLKTTSSTPDEWFKYARQFRYDFQMAWYYDIIEKLFPEYRQLMPELIVYSFAAPNKPFTKVITLDDLQVGRNGINLQKSFVEYDGGVVEPISERIMGWEECLSRYLICQENGWPDFDVNYWQQSGTVSKNIW